LKTCCSRVKNSMVIQGKLFAINLSFCYFMRNLLRCIDLFLLHVIADTFANVPTVRHN
jgi:hypothetical protein